MLVATEAMVAAPIVEAAGLIAAAALAIVALVMDCAAFTVLRAPDALLLDAPDMPVAAGVRLHPVDARLTALEAADFAIGQLAAANAVLDSLLLDDVAPHVPLHAPR